MFETASSLPVAVQIKDVDPAPRDIALAPMLPGDLPAGDAASSVPLDLLQGFRGEGRVDHEQDPAVGRGANFWHWNLEALDPEQAVVSTGGSLLRYNSATNTRSTKVEQGRWRGAQKVRHF